ncbi:non-ribosomal peptide synthetase [Brevundimonas sp.]|uniref:non-ribosomal peptide synthetase n=1 Tax=Brevundimonas sp. TaxID=1871086 RepID=UPI002FDB3BAB
MRRAVAETLRRHADRPALVAESGDVWTYARLETEARAVAAELPGPCLTVIEGGNAPSTIAAYLGVLLNGGLAHLAESGRADALRAAFGPLVLIRCGDMTTAIETGDDKGSGEGVHPDLVLLFSTSGTTGASKMVKITNGAIRSNTEAIVDYLGLTAEDRAITSLKPTYTYGLSVIHSTLLSGGALLLTDRSVQDPAFWRFARTHGATTLSGVPHTWEVLADGDDLERTPSLRLLTQAGGKLRPELVRRFAERGRKAGWDFCVMYGQTEAAPRMAYLPPKLAETAPEAMGVAIPGGELSLQDEQGRTIDTPETEGELIYRGPNVMAGYATRRADLAAAQSLGRLATGDLAVRRPDGLFVITGRRSRFIKPLGVRIGLDEVERLLAARGVTAAAVAQGEGLLVVCEGAEATSAAHLAQELGLPTTLVETRRVDALPRLVSGKPDYGALKPTTPSKAWLPAHPLRFARDTAVETWRLLAGGGDRTRAVVDVFRDVLRRPVTMTDSFTSLGADSLNYVELSVALEDVMGRLPDGWTHMSVEALEHRREAWS